MPAARPQILSLDHFGISMDALFRGLLLVGAISSIGAGYQTPNFTVTAPTPEFAKQVGEAAEVYRRELAVEWTGAPLPGNWSKPCPIEVKVGTMGAGGATTFNFQNGEVYGWKMEIFGSEERIMDSVLPHEINHTIFACYFRRPLPRWADEGAASLIENESERMRLRRIHDQVMNTTRKIPLKSLLNMKNYPKEKQEVLTLYAEGHSLADFLIQRSDKPTYLKFLQQAHEQSWEAALKEHYRFDSVDDLEKVWDKWVLAGSRPLKLPKGSQIADNNRAPANPAVRGQSPEEDARPTLPRQEPTPDPEVAAVGLSRESLIQPVFTPTSRSGAARVPHSGTR
jgi:hypothetical protein